jgi:hypothetical protein
MTLRDPATGERITVGREILLEQEELDGKNQYLGKFKAPEAMQTGRNLPKGILITRTFSLDGLEILKQGEILGAPYCILKVAFDHMSMTHRISEALRFKKKRPDTGRELTEIY